MTPHPVCSVPDCSRPVRAKGFCNPHYKRSRTGDMDKPIGRYPKRDPAERFWAKVEQTESCWLWTGALTGKGYGLFSVDSRNAGAHRFAYELLVEPIPNGLVIDHLCRNRACVNPSHMEPVTNRENTIRGTGPRSTAERCAAQTHCKRGHEFTPENTRMNKGRRQCRSCQRIYDLRKKEKAA